MKIGETTMRLHAEANNYANDQFSLNAIEWFYATVNDMAEKDMLKGNPVTGAHHRALERLIQIVRSEKSLPPTPESEAGE
jgi:hypothetical protein